MENNRSGAFLLLIVCAVILTIGYFAFNFASSSIDGTSASNNVTAGVTNTVSSIIPMLLIVVAFVIIVGLISWSVSSTKRYQIVNKRVEKILAFLDTTTIYFGYGLLAYAIFGTIGLSLYLIYRLTIVAGETGVGFAIGKILLIIIVVFFGTAGVGYLFKKYIWDKWKERKAEKERLIVINDLPKAIE